jgi:predicted phage replisome organizer
MADVKWIKITTDIFDDDKILLIESLPEKDSLIVIWFKLLCLAGKQNNSGVFTLNDRIAYTDEMLSTIFRRPLNTIRLALRTFQEYGMIEIIDGVITIPNWDKHQSLDAYEKKKARDRLYQQERRNKQKLLASKKSSDSSSEVVVTDKDIDKEIDKDIDINNKKPVRHKYGEYKNVLFTDTDFEKLKTEFPNDWEERVENLSEYIAKTGRAYKNHLAVIRSWAKKEQKQPTAQPTQQKSEYNSFMDQLAAMRE